MRRKEVVPDSDWREFLVEPGVQIWGRRMSRTWN